jgi:hypothetical protein
MKIDPYKQKERYFSWKEKVKYGIPNLSEFQTTKILKILKIM